MSEKFDIRRFHKFDEGAPDCLTFDGRIYLGDDVRRLIKGSNLKPLKRTDEFYWEYEDGNI